jgi:hypothetical protein
MEQARVPSSQQRSIFRGELPLLPCAAQMERWGGLLWSEPLSDTQEVSCFGKEDSPSFKGLGLRGGAHPWERLLTQPEACQERVLGRWAFLFWTIWGSVLRCTSSTGLFSVLDFPFSLLWAPSLRSAGGNRKWLPVTKIEPGSKKEAWEGKNVIATF